MCANAGHQPNLHPCSHILLFCITDDCEEVVLTWKPDAGFDDHEEEDSQLLDRVAGVFQLRANDTDLVNDEPTYRSDSHVIWWCEAAEAIMVATAEAFKAFEMNASTCDPAATAYGLSIPSSGEIEARMNRQVKMHTGPPAWGFDRDGAPEKFFSPPVYPPSLEPPPFSSPSSAPSYPPSSPHPLRLPILPHTLHALINTSLVLACLYSKALQAPVGSSVFKNEVILRVSKNTGVNQCHFNRCQNVGRTYGRLC